MIFKSYKPASGARYGSEQAAVLGAVLEGLQEITPAALVDSARDESSPVHSMFTWDDGLAAELYRQSEAGHHIRHLRIVIEKDSGDTQETRAFFSVKAAESDGEENGQRTYVHVSTVASSPDLSEQVIAQAKRELGSWRDRYSEYRSVFGSVFAAIEGLPKAS